MQDEYKGGYLSAAFVSSLDDFIKSSNINLWIHGHTHHNVDYVLGNTRIIANQRGYAGYDLCNKFNKQLIIEIYYLKHYQQMVIFQQPFKYGGRTNNF